MEAASQPAKQSQRHKKAQYDGADAANHRLLRAKRCPLTAALGNVTLDLLVSELVVDHGRQRNRVAKELQRGHVGAPDEHGRDHEEYVLEHAADGEDDGRRLANQEHQGDVEHKCAEAVEEKGKEADVEDLGERHLGHLPDEGHGGVDDGAHGRKVVERDEGVHFEVGGQQALDHGQARGLEHDTRDLNGEAGEDKVDLAVRRDDDAEDNDGDVDDLLRGGCGHAQGPAGEQDGHWRRCLEHLDKGDGEVQVGEVAADETRAEEDANGDNSTQVDPACHLDRSTAVEQCGEPCHDLGHDSGKDKVVGCENDGVACVFGMSVGLT